MFFQQYGAPPYYAVPVLQCLNENFKGLVVADLFSGFQGLPDLSFLNCFLWGHLNFTIFKKQPDSLQVLQESTTVEYQRITQYVAEC